MLAGTLKGIMIRSNNAVRLRKVGGGDKQLLKTNPAGCSQNPEPAGENGWET